jgi:hypothetical protein
MRARKGRLAVVAAREPELNEPVTALPESAKGKGGPTFRATIPSTSTSSARTASSAT